MIEKNIIHNFEQLSGYELSGEESKALGHILYGVLFAPIRADCLADDPVSLSGRPPRVDLLALPAEQYVENFARQYRLNGDWLKACVDSAAKEIADAFLSATLDDLKYQTAHHNAFALKAREAAQLAKRIAVGGIQASVRDHKDLINSAEFSGHLRFTL